MNRSQRAPSGRRDVADGADHAGRRLLVICIAAIATRLLTFGNPILNSDEEFYFAVGRGLIDGALPFVDIWDRKPIGLFLVYALPAAMPWPWGIWLYQAMATASAAATAWLIAKLATRAGWDRGATLAGIAYLGWVTVAGGQGGQSPIFYNLPIILAAWIATGSRHRARDALAAMLLVGVAVQIKYTAALEGAWIGLWLMHRHLLRQGFAAAIGRGVWMAVVALAPTMVAALYYRAVGAWPAFLYANLLSIFGRRPDPGLEIARNIAVVVATLAPLLALAAARGPARQGDAATRAFLNGWLAMAVAAFVIVPPWFDHYMLPVMVPAAIPAAGFLADPRRRRVGVAVVALAVIAGQIAVAIDQRRRGNAAQFATLARAVGNGPGCLYVYSSTAMLYPATGRCALSRYVFPSHLVRDREAGAIGVDPAVELARLIAAGPAVVVMIPPYRGERGDIRALALRLMVRDYRVTARVRMGRKVVTVLTRRTPGTGAPVARFD